MAGVQMKVTYVVELTAEEFRIVMAALKGEVKKEWKEKAEQLQDKMWRERAAQSKQFMEAVTKAVREAEERR